MILSILLAASTANAQRVSWEPPEGAHEKYTIGGYRLSYEIFHPEEECASVETKYFLDLGEVYFYELHKDINFRPGYHYYIALDTYTKEGEVSKPTVKGACTTIRGNPEPVSHVDQNDDYELFDNVDESAVYGSNKTIKERIFKDEEDIYFPSSNVPSPISDGRASETDLDTVMGEHSERSDGSGWVSGVLGRGGDGSIKLDRPRNAERVRRTRRETVQLQPETVNASMVTRGGVLLSNDSLLNERPNNIGVGQVRTGLQNNGNLAPFPARDSRSRIASLIAIILLVALGIWGVTKVARPQLK